jgi:hypothetical protein
VFLARDINKNGMIDSGAELFGQATRMRNGGLPVNGFVALRDLDSNNDLVFDRKDESYKDILVWWDQNGDGVSQAQELKPASEVMKSMDLNFQAAHDEDSNGNLVMARSSFVNQEGIVREVVDIFFKFIE